MRRELGGCCLNRQLPGAVPLLYPDKRVGASNLLPAPAPVRRYRHWPETISPGQHPSSASLVRSYSGPAARWRRSSTRVACCGCEPLETAEAIGHVHVRTRFAACSVPALLRIASRRSPAYDMPEMRGSVPPLQSILTSGAESYPVKGYEDKMFI